jgi:hypothetical protein
VRAGWLPAGRWRRCASTHAANTGANAWPSCKKMESTGGQKAAKRSRMNQIGTNRRYQRGTASTFNSGNGDIMNSLSALSTTHPARRCQPGTLLDVASPALWAAGYSRSERLRDAADRGRPAARGHVARRPGAAPRDTRRSQQRRARPSRSLVPDGLQAK